PTTSAPDRPPACATPGRSRATRARGPPRRARATRRASSRSPSGASRRPARRPRTATARTSRWRPGAPPPAPPPRARARAPGPAPRPPDPSRGVLEVIPPPHPTRVHHARQLPPRGPGQRLRAHVVGGVVEELPGEREAPVPVRPLAQHGVAVLGRFAP